MKYIVIEVGCLECGLRSSLVGKFAIEDEANTFADEHNKTHGTDIDYVVFDLDKIEECRP
jgi:hypothetical protein